MAEKEYIEREALFKTIENIPDNELLGNDNTTFVELPTVLDIISEQPVANVQEVRHGKWIEKPYLLGTSNFCSLCLQNFGMPHGKFNFCPNCGAKMELRNSEND